MATEEKWYFTKEQLENTPSRQCAIDSYKELFYRQQAANFIQDMGQRLRVSQLCINTATVYMHRFYVFHSFTQFPWHSTAAAALFLSAKVEEQPRKLEHVIRVHNVCKNPRDTAIDVHSERYLTQSQDLVFNENILLQTLGFDVAIDHPHAHVVRCCHLVRASKDLAQTSYFMASTSLHLTTMCLQYKPTVVACFCIHLVCKWSNWEIPLSNEKKEWFSYVDPSVTSDLLAQLTEEFLVIFDKCPSRLKEKIMAIYRNTGHVSSPFETEARKLHPPSESKDPHHRAHHHDKTNADDPHKHRSRPPHENNSSGGSSSSQQQRDYREKKDSERIAQHTGKAIVPHTSSSSKQPNMPHGHHRPATDPKMKQHSRPPSTSHPSATEPHRDILRDATRDIGIRDSHRDPTRVSGDKLDKDLQVRSDKDLEKRAYSVKPPGSDGSNMQSSSEHLNHSGDKRFDTSRSRLGNDPSKMLQHNSRRHDEQKSQNDVRKQMNASWYDKNNMHMKQQQMANSTSQKTKSPFTPDTPKSVPKKFEQFNGNSNGSFSLPLFDEPKIVDNKDEFQYQAPVKKPSMFSPEKTPPRKTPVVKPPNIPAPISPIESLGKHSRSSSLSTEPELRPVMKKIDHVEGFENILRDSTIGIKHQAENQVQELKPPDVNAVSMMNSSTCSVPLSQPIVNGIETNPTLISNLLKEVPSVPHLPTIVHSMQEENTSVTTEVKDKEHHHKERKKKNKEKHKHKDKDKNKEEKEKKKKHKDKDKDKHKSKRDKEKQDESLPAQPIKITISKDKIQPPETQSVGLKIKIPKDRIKTDGIGETSAPAPGIKIKIPKDVISNMGSDSNKKREREKSSPSDGPPNKISKSSFSRQHGDKQNGRNSYGKVAHMGDGDTSMHRLAESKYINKGAST